MLEHYELYNKDSQAVVFGYQQLAIQRMLDFDYICRRRTPSVAAIINPTRSGFHKVFFGSREILIPIYTSLAECCRKHPHLDVCVNFASHRSAFAATMECIENTPIKTVAVIAEGIPERHTRMMNVAARKIGKWIIGPATVGGVAAGQFRIGNAAGTIENIISCKMHRPGRIGFVSKSGGLSNEMYNICARNADGVYEGVAIGGDRYPGTRYMDHLQRFEENPKIKMMVVLGEVGGTQEYEIVEALQTGKLTKPVVAWCTGTCACAFNTEIQFGHAGARADGEDETAQAKNLALQNAGAHVPFSFNDFGKMIHEVFSGLRTGKDMETETEVAPPKLPMDFNEAVAKGLVRRPATYINTISDERGNELLFGGKPLSKIFEQNDAGVGDVIGLLWFKQELPRWASRFLEIVLMIAADHGPAVSAAHNAIVTARAGKDIISCLCAGLLPIGPRFGGAVDGAAQTFYPAWRKQTPPAELIRREKAAGRNIQGIGHRIKSVGNPDLRVSELVKYARNLFPGTEVLDYAFSVQALTTAKKGNLILNVDGAIGALCVDMMRHLGTFSDDEVQEFVDIGVLNGLFALARTIGIIGHVIDQKRHKQPMYRHPWDDILFGDGIQPART